MSSKFDALLNKLRLRDAPADLDSRVILLEGTTYEFTFWREISSGTSGTLTKPTGSTILLDRWPGDIDSVVSVVTTGEVPDEEYAYTTSGDIVTSTLDTDGDWTLSAAPSSYPVAIIGRASIPLSALKALIDGGEILLDYEKIDDGIRGINYANPIAANSTSTITPVDGAYYTSTSKLVTLTGSGSEKFWPNNGETSRIIWGTGASAAATLTINPVNLVIGNTFEIALEDGESRKLLWDGTDFTKIDGGVVIPLFCAMHNNTTVPVAVTDSTLTKFNLDVTDSDPSGQMADPTTNYRIDIIRGGVYSVSPNLQWGDLSSSHTLDHETQTRAKYTGSVTNYKTFTGYIHAGQNLGEGNSFGLSETPTLAAADFLELYAFHVTVGTAEGLNVYGPTANNSMFAREVDPW